MKQQRAALFANHDELNSWLLNNPFAEAVSLCAVPSGLVIIYAEGDVCPDEIGPGFIDEAYKAGKDFAEFLRNRDDTAERIKRCSEPHE